MRLAVLLLLAGTALAKTPQVPVANPGALVLTSTVDGADVFVDGNKVGTTPLSPMPFPPGDHTIKVIKLGFSPYIDVFTINRKKPTNLSVEPVPVAGVVKVT